jgi:hypothetical protein
MCPDDVTWELAEEISDKWLSSISRGGNLETNRGLHPYSQQRQCNRVAILKKGSYNVSLRVKYRKGAIVLRFSQPGAVFFPEEKS